MLVLSDARWTTYTAMRALDEEKKSNVRAAPRSSCVVARIPTFPSWSHMDVDITERSRRVRIAHGSPRKRPARRARDTPDVPSRTGRSGAHEHLVVLERRTQVPVDSPRGRRAAVQPASAAEAPHVA